MEAVDNVTRMVTDTERAFNLKERVRPHLEAVCSVMDEARAQGLVLNFQIGTNGFTRSMVRDISVIKPL